MAENTTDQVRLTVNGQIHDGWTEATVKRSIEQIAGTFDLTLTEKWSGQTTRRPIAAGSACRLHLGDDLVISGWIDDARPSITASDHSVQASGRDATGDLVDCSAVHSPGEWKDQNLTQICAALCAPFGIGVTALTDIGTAFASFAIDEGETAFEAIERACRMRAVLPVSDSRGGLILTRADHPGAPVAELRTGADGNVLSATGGTSLRDRFSVITVKGQSQGDDFKDVTETASASGAASDSNVKRYRPLIVIAEDQGDGTSFADRAVWETSVRRARSRTAEVAVQGWRRSNGQLWSPLDVVRTAVPELGLPETMLVTTVELTQSAEGTLTRLSLAPPKAFELIALKGDEDEESLW